MEGVNKAGQKSPSQPGYHIEEALLIIGELALENKLLRRSVVQLREEIKRQQTAMQETAGPQRDN